MFFNPSVQEILNCDDRDVEYSIVFATTVDDRNVKDGPLLLPIEFCSSKCEQYTLYAIYVC